MFDLTKEVPSLELCKKLKELGYPQNDGWYWVRKEGKWHLILQETVSRSVQRRWKIQYEEIIKAPTVRELGERLREEVRIINHKCAHCDKILHLKEFKLRDMFYVQYYEKQRWVKDCGVVEYKEHIIKQFYDKHEANARAEMLIWLVENGHIKFN